MSDSFSVDAWYAAVSAHDLPRMREFLLSNSRYEDVPTGTVSEGVEAVLAFFQGTWAAIPDMEMHPTQVLQTTSGVAAEWIATGTHSGDFPGLPATGNTFKVRGVSFIELQDGHLRRSSDYWDLATSGLLGAPAAAPAPEVTEDLSRAVGN